MDKTGLNSRLSLLAHWLGSLKLAVVLLLTLASVIACATVLEARHGREHALWYVYHSGWFMVLLGLLGINILSAALSRLPWKRHHTGFVVTHLGLLVLLTGAAQSFVGGVDGQVTLAEGESVSRMIIPHQTQISAAWEGKPGEAPYHFTFEAGPGNWHEATTLDLGEVDGVGARVLRHISHAVVKENWHADESGVGGPVLKFKIEGPHSSGSEQHLLVDQEFGDELFVGPVRVQLRRATSKAMVDDFLKPPTDLGKKGLLLAYYQDHVKHIKIDDLVGKKVAMADSGVAVEIAEYFASAKPDMNHRFRSAGDEPRDPLLELKVHVPGKKPLRQVAFAKSPLVSLDPMLGQACPVRFHYLHPAVRSETAVEFLQANDGRLHARVFADQRMEPRNNLAVGARFNLPQKFVLSLVEHIPNARQQIVFESLPAGASEKDKPESAAEIEITAGAATQTFWLQRNHPSLGMRRITTPQGGLFARMGHCEAALGFSLKLVEFRKSVNPGGIGNATFTSVVRLLDKDQGIDEEHIISMNEPLTHNGLTFYQSGFNEAGHGLKTSTLSVSRDPGRFVKYAGSLLICLGIAIMFYMRAYFFKKAVATPNTLDILERRNPASSAEMPHEPAAHSEGVCGRATRQRQSAECEA